MADKFTAAHDEWRLYNELAAEMDGLRALPDLSREQAERWASLSATRALFYIEPSGWTCKAVPRADGRYQLVRMHAVRFAKDRVL